MVMCSSGDFMIRAVLKEHAVRIAFGDFTDLATAGILRHDADPLAGLILGKALISGALASVLLNENERYSIRLDYEAPVRGLILDVTGTGEVRGFIRHPHVMTEVSDLEQACGKGCTITMTKSENGKVLNSGQTECSFIEPDAAFSYFFSVSDQIESEICSHLRFRPDPQHPVCGAPAIMLQALPDCDLEFFDQMRKQLYSAAAAAMLCSNESAPENRLEKLMQHLCSTSEIPALDMTRVPAPEFICHCSAQKLWETAKIMLGDDDFAKLLSENPDPEIRCQFCNTVHRFSAGQ